MVNSLRSGRRIALLWLLVSCFALGVAATVFDRVLNLLVDEVCHVEVKLGLLVVEHVQVTILECP